MLAYRLRAAEIAASIGCQDCGEVDPVVLEFDHRDDKIMDVSTMIGSRSWSVIQAEIAKCDVVCANCHRRRTAKRFGWYNG